MVRCQVLDLRPTRTNPYTQQTNGKAVRFIKTLVPEWACVIASQTSAERNRWRPHNLGISIRQRAKWLSVASRLSSASNDALMTSVKAMFSSTQTSGVTPP